VLVELVVPWAQALHFQQFQLLGVEFNSGQLVALAVEEWATTLAAIFLVEQVPLIKVLLVDPA
jgi:hypothetical protein